MLSEYKGEFQHRFCLKRYKKLYVPKFTCKEKSGAYSVYSYSRIASIEHLMRLDYDLQRRFLIV